MSKKLDTLLEQYGALGHSDQHKENTQFAKDFIDIMNGNSITEADEDADKKLVSKMLPALKKLNKGLDPILSAFNKLSPEGKKMLSKKIDNLEDALSALDDGLDDLFEK